MSLLPYLIERRRFFDQIRDQLSLGLEDNELDLLSPLMSGDRPWRSMSRDSGSIKTDKTKFQVNLDVHHFAPEDITVKTVDGCIVVEGNHEEKRDEHGWVSRKFIRRYPLPEGCNVEAVQSRLSSDGVLSVVAPLDTPLANERVVPIVPTGPVRKQAQEKEL